MSKPKGVYLLFFTIPSAVEAEIGKLGRYSFLPGRYVYVGSGMGGVFARVKRHLCGCQTERWHIDYLLEKAADRKAVIYLTDNKEMECLLSQMVKGTAGSQNPVKGFGSSDCGCYSHLYLISDETEVLNIDLPGCSKTEVLTCKTIVSKLEKH